jgi:hypothetical protein
MDQRNMLSSMIFFLIAAFVLILSVGLGIGSLSSPQTGFMPFGISLLMIVFSLVLFGTAYVDRSIAVRWKDLWKNVRWRKNLPAAAGLFLYVLILPLAGFLIATCALMMMLFRLNAMKIWTAGVCAVLSVCAAYGLFHFILKTPLPRSIWGF